MADINKRGPDCEDGEGGERGERGERGHRGHRGHDGHDGHDGATGATGPSGRDAVVNVDPRTLAGDGTPGNPLTVIGYPRQQPFVEDKTIFIYARLSGSDTTGDGSLANPYRTFEFAIRQVPSIIDAGVIYRVDITGIGLEQLPTEYVFPLFVGAESTPGQFDFTQRFFHLFTSVNVQADPELFQPLTGSNVVPGGVSTTDPNTGLREIFVAGAGWTPGDLVGKFAIGAGTASEHSVIWKNTADTIFITRTGMPTFPIQIMKHSAQLQADKRPAGFGQFNGLQDGAINVWNTQVALLGLKVNATPAPINPLAPDFANWGLHISGDTPAVVLQLCDLPGAGITTAQWTRTRQCYLPGLLFAMAPNLITQCFIDRSFNPGGLPPGGGVTVWGARGADSLFRQTVIKETTPLHFRDLFDVFASGSIGTLELNNVQILDTLPELPPGDDFPINDGVLWNGVIARFEKVNISRTVPPIFGPPGSAIKVKGNGAYLRLHSVTGSGYGEVGCKVVDGGNVEVDDGGDPPTTLNGALGDVLVGSLGVLPWPAPYPADNYADYTSLAAQGARLWRKGP